MSASVPWASTGSSSSSTHGSPLSGSVSPLSTSSSPSTGTDATADGVGSSLSNRTMVSPSWSAVNLMKNDVTMIVRKVKATILTVCRSHFTADPAG